MAIRQGHTLLIYADTDAIEKFEQRQMWFLLFLMSLTIIFWVLNIKVSAFIIGPITAVLFLLQISSRKHRQQLKRQNPLIYSFMEDGFISHTGRNDVKHLWSEFKTVVASKHSVKFTFKPKNSKKLVSATIMYASPEDLLSIAQHIQQYAPERLHKYVKIK